MGKTIKGKEGRNALESIDRDWGQRGMLGDEEWLMGEEGVFIFACKRGGPPLAGPRVANVHSFCKKAISDQKEN